MKSKSSENTKLSIDRSEKNTGLNDIKNIIWCTLLGTTFGVFFGAVAAIFQGGPDVFVGIRETWWWFSLAGALKGISDLRIKK